MPSAAWHAIFAFELRYQLRQPLIYLVTFVLSVLLFIAGTGSDTPAALHINAPVVVLQNLAKGIYLILFLLIAIVTSTAVRDFDRHTDALFFSKPLSARDYLSARFAGTVVVCALPYLIGTSALAVSALMPDVDRSRVGPLAVTPYVFALGVLVLPTIASLGAISFAVASWTRSAVTTYTAIVALLALSAIAGVIITRPGLELVGQLLDPFGLTALAGSVRNWTSAELNMLTPSIGGVLLGNRIVWLAIGLAVFALLAWRFDPGRTQPARAVSVDDNAPPFVSARRAVTRSWSFETTVALLVQRTRLEARVVITSLPFLGMLSLGLVVLVVSANDAGSIFGMPVYPRTYLMIEALQGSYSIVLLLVVVLFSGEAVWRERSIEMHEIHDIMPVSSGVYLGGKVSAMLMVVALYLCIGVIVLMGWQLLQGFREIEFALYARAILMAAIYPSLMLVLAIACHVLARNKFIGYGAVLLFIVAWDLLEELGFEHHLYRYASLPAAPYSDFNGFGPFSSAFVWLAGYWGSVALALVGVSALLWKRGTDSAWSTRIAEVPQRFRGGVRYVTVLGAVTAGSIAGWIYYNTNVLNRYESSPSLATRRARYEQRYRRYEALSLPRVTAVYANVAIYPTEGRVALNGRYTLRNGTRAPMRQVHVSLPEGVHLDSLVLPAETAPTADSASGYFVYRLRTPLAPGDSMAMSFAVTLGHRGFVNDRERVEVVSNGSYFTKRELFPVIGYDVHRELSDVKERRKYKLPEDRTFPPATDTAARLTSPRAPDADRVSFDATVSTSADQTAVTTGTLVRSWTDHGRRFFHYRADDPITWHVAFVSARYAVEKRLVNGVSLELYHHPSHTANIARMLNAASVSLRYGTEQFGPYRPRQLRIVETPRYVRDATSFPEMIAFAESMGFNAKVTGAEAIDFPFYVTAHEVAHQWWGQQLVGANVQGTGMLHESLAQYVALMCVEHALGSSRVAPILSYERDWYLRGRSSERGTEPSLAQVGREDYVYYHKGALVMHALRDAMGEMALNGALHSFYTREALRGPPYASAAGLLDELRAIGTPAALVDSLFLQRGALPGASASLSGLQSVPRSPVRPASSR